MTKKLRHFTDVILCCLKYYDEKVCRVQNTQESNVRIKMYVNTPDVGVGFIFLNTEKL